MDNPIAITVLTLESTVTAKHSSYAVVEFGIPIGQWIGIGSDNARTPLRTKIIPESTPGFRFEAPIFPDGQEEWLATKLGRTKVYKGIVKIVVPFSVEANVPPQNYDLTFLIIYTPSHSAGKLSTHVKGGHSFKVRAADDSCMVTVPQPSLAPISSDFEVASKSFDGIPNGLKWLCKPNSIVKGLHKVWLEKPGNGKSERFSPFPSSSVSIITGSSIGLGAVVFNSTRAGAMTGSMSLSGFTNNLNGSGVFFTAISYPKAYYNYQFSVSFGGEGYRDINFTHENYTVAEQKNSYNVSFRCEEAPRYRFNGIGNNTVEAGATAYGRTLLHAGLDLYSEGPEFQVWYWS